VRNAVLFPLFLLVCSAPGLAAGQGITKIRASDAAWKALVEAGTPGSVFAFEPGIYHTCDISLNSGEIILVLALRNPAYDSQLCVTISM